MDALRRALETKDLDAAEALLADDCVFTSPALFKPYQGRALTMVFLRAVAEVFENFRYLRTFTEDGGRGHVMMFAAEVGGRELEGIDMVRLDDDGKVCDFKVMIRPMSGLIALAEAMAPKVEQGMAELS